ncbi:MAG: two-component regulator propeller domain-containing protein, partial [Balneolales bacterium]
MLCSPRVSQLLILLTLLLMACVSLQAQSLSDIQFQRYGLKQGMPNTFIFDMHQDRQGYMWFSTRVGIVRFDGYDYQTFAIEPEDGGITSSKAGNIVEDQDGVVWVGFQENHYLARYDRDLGTFEFLDVEKMTDAAGPTGQIELLGLDSGNNLWLTLSGDSIESPLMAKLAVADQSLHVFTDEAAGDSLLKMGEVIPRTFARYVNYEPFLAGGDGSVWIGAEKGMVHIQPDNSVRVYRNEDNLEQNRVYYFLERANGDVWAATEGGLLVKQEADEAFGALAVPEALEGRAVYYLYRDQQGAVWITADNNTWRYDQGEFEPMQGRESLSELGEPTMMPQAEDERFIWFINRQNDFISEERSQGLSIYNKEEDEFLAITSRTEAIPGLTFIDGFSGVYKSRDGSTWLTVWNEGVYRYSDTRLKFPSYFNSDEFKEKVVDNFVYRAEESPEGYVFSGTSNGKILVADPATGRETVFHEFEQLRDIVPEDRNFITYFLWEQPGQVLVTTERSGLQRLYYDTETLEVTRTQYWPQSLWDEDGVPLNMIYDDSGALWIGTSYGLVHANLDTKEFQVMNATEVDYDSEEYFGSFVRKDKYGHLWYYFVDGAGIKRVDPEEKTIHFFNVDEIDGELEMDVFQVQDFLEHSDGSVFISTLKGISNLNEARDHFEPFAPHIKTGIWPLLEGDDGHIIAGTQNSGVVWLNRQEEIVHRLTREDGLPDNSIVKLAFDDEDEFVREYFPRIAHAAHAALGSGESAGLGGERHWRGLG